MLSLLAPKTFATHGLPPLGPQKGSSSSASHNERHKPANFEQREFKPIKNLTLLAGATRIWSAHRQGMLRSWGSEKKIQTLIQDVMVDAIASVGLQNQLECQEELSIFKLRPDIWIVTSLKGVPVGVVEVKKDDAQIMDAPLLHGQIYDYMLRLQSFHGLRHVFGIASTYNQWRFYWLPSCDKIAAKDHVNEFITVKENKEEEDDESEGQNEIEGTDEVTDEY